MATKFLEPGGDATFIENIITNGGFWETVQNLVVETDFVHGTHVKSLGGAVNTQWFAFAAAGTAADTGARKSFYIYLNALPSATATLSFIMKSDNTRIVRVRITSAGALQLWEASAQIGSNGATLATGAWYRISLAYTITDTTHNRFELFVDAVSSISITNATIATTASSKIGLGNLDGDATIDMRFSDIYVDNSSALTDPGNIWVTAKRPFANGAANDFGTQIGAGGSGYGTGHSPQVNERPASNTNGWSVINAGSIKTEQYTIEGASVGDIDITGATIVDYMAWAIVKALASETGTLLLEANGTTISITSTITLFKVANSELVGGPYSYPTGNTAFGLKTDATVTTVSLYEAGILFAFIPNVVEGSTAKIDNLLFMGVG